MINNNEYLVEKFPLKMSKYMITSIIGKSDTHIKPKSIIKYKTFILYTFKVKKEWQVNEFKSGASLVQFRNTEESAILEAIDKIKNWSGISGFYKIVKHAIANNGFASHARYSNLLYKKPKKLKSCN